MRGYAWKVGKQTPLDVAEYSGVRDLDYVLVRGGAADPTNTRKATKTQKKRMRRWTTRQNHRAHEKNGESPQ